MRTRRITTAAVATVLLLGATACEDEDDAGMDETEEMEEMDDGDDMSDDDDGMEDGMEGDDG